MRLIDADKLQEAFKELHGGKRSLLIDTEPTADVVEVVRCKDCIYYSDGECKSGILPFSEYSDLHSVWLTPKPNDFCSYGERKNE